MSNRIPTQACCFAHMSTVIPQSWVEWFHAEFVEGAPFSWGDNDRTLITVRRFRSQAEKLIKEFPREELSPEELVTLDEEIEQVRSTLETLEKAGCYVDLEN